MILQPPRTVIRTVAQATETSQANSDIVAPAAVAFHGVVATVIAGGLVFLALANAAPDPGTKCCKMKTVEARSGVVLPCALAKALQMQRFRSPQGRAEEQWQPDSTADGAHGWRATFQGPWVGLRLCNKLSSPCFCRMAHQHAPAKFHGFIKNSRLVTRT